MYGARLGLVSGAHTKKRAALGMETPKTALAYQNPCTGRGLIAVAILPHNEPNSGSDNPAVDLKRTLLTNVSGFKSVSKTNAWIDGMFALREDAEEADSIGFCSRIFTQLSLPYRDSGNDESSPSWLAMINKADALIVPTITRPEHAESARLLLNELAHSGQHGAKLAQNALVIVLQASKAEPTPNQLVQTFKQITRDAIGINYDPAMSARPLMYETLNPASRRAWLAAAAALTPALQ